MAVGSNDILEGQRKEQGTIARVLPTLRNKLTSMVDSLTTLVTDGILIRWSDDGDSTVVSEEDPLPVSVEGTATVEVDGRADVNLEDIAEALSELNRNLEVVIRHLEGITDVDIDQEDD
jgi:hypothetical protein